MTDQDRKSNSVNNPKKRLTAHFHRTGNMYWRLSIESLHVWLLNLTRTLTCVREMCWPLFFFSFFLSPLKKKKKKKLLFSFPSFSMAPLSTLSDNSAFTPTVLDNMDSNQHRTCWTNLSKTELVMCTDEVCSCAYYCTGYMEWKRTIFIGQLVWIVIINWLIYEHLWCLWLLMHS